MNKSLLDILSTTLVFGKSEILKQMEQTGAKKRKNDDPFNIILEILNMRSIFSWKHEIKNGNKTEKLRDVSNFESLKMFAF